MKPVCLLLLIIGFVWAEEALLVFDLFEEGNEMHAAADENVEKLLLPPLQGNVILVTINWNGGFTFPAENTLWKLGTHPNIVAHLNMKISSQHRAKNIAIDEILQAVSQEEELKDLSITHILLANQDLSFNAEDVDQLLRADRDFVGGIIPSATAPFYPSFIPYPDVMRMKSVKDMYNNVLEQEETLPVLALSANLLLAKVKALQTIRKPFGSKGEWFWMSEETALWSVGDCYDITTSIPTTKRNGMSLQQKQDYKKMIEEIGIPMLEEDLCFNKNVKRFGYELYVHPLVRPSISRSLQMAYHSNNIEEVHQVIDGSRVGANVVENRVKNVRSFFTVGDQHARTIVATAIWSDIETKTAASFYSLSSHSDFIGRVSIDHTEIILARNLLIEKIEEEFGDTYTHVLFVDGDMTFTLSDYERLLYADVDLAFGIAVKRGDASFPPAFLPLAGSDDYGSLLQAYATNPPSPVSIKGAGMAFTLIKREVFQKLSRESSSRPGSKEWFWTEHIIDREYHKEQHLSEDYSFCHRARQNGFTLSLIPSVVLGHIDERVNTIHDWLDVNNIEYSN